MDDDILKGYSEAEVQAWYERLARSTIAESTSAGVAEPLAGQFLLHYIGKNGTNKLGDPLRRFAPVHLKQSPSVTSVQAFHRRVFLTEEKGHFGVTKGLLGATKVVRWVGLVPRLQSKAWDGKSEISLEYESLSDIAPTLFDILKLQAEKNPSKMDIFTSLRGWQLKSAVKVKGAAAAGGMVEVEFTSWLCSGEDVYDFNQGEYLTLPNPDFESKETFAIAPSKKEIKVYHTNALRLEKKGLAKPYPVLISYWAVSDHALLAKAKIDPAKKLAN